MAVNLCARFWIQRIQVNALNSISFESPHAKRDLSALLGNFRIGMNFKLRRVVLSLQGIFYEHGLPKLE